MDMDHREEQMTYKHEENKQTTICPACQGDGEVSSLRELYIHNTARFNCTCGHWLILTPFKDAVVCIKCGEIWRWVVFSDSQIDKMQSLQRTNEITSEEAEEIMGRFNAMLKALNDVSSDVAGIINNTNNTNNHKS